MNSNDYANNTAATRSKISTLLISYDSPLGSDIAYTIVRQSLVCA